MQHMVEPTFSLAQVSPFLQATRKGADTTFSGISTDTRTLVPGNLFVALQGERFDGHNFLEEAIKQGAACAMVSRPVETTLPVLEVADTERGLQRLAMLWRQHFSSPVIGVTGSCGKTTVKEMIAAILTEEAMSDPSYTGQEAVLVTQGNLNNQIGVPLTLFKLHDKHRFAVIEMGASRAGDIAELVEMVKPDISLITNVGPAHLQGFGSLEGVAKAKGEIFTAAGIAVLNADDEFFSYWRDHCSYQKAVTFGTSKEADVRADNIAVDAEGFAAFDLKLAGQTIAIKCPLPGKHQVHNVLAAVATTQPLKVASNNIQAGLNRVKPLPGRMSFCKGVKGAQVIDDSYNANLLSVKAAIQTLAGCEGKKILVLGDLAELGVQSQVIHEQIGQEAKARHISELLTVGAHSRFASKSFGGNARHFEKIEELILHLQTLLKPEVTVLVKGSRASRMERVVKGICCFG